MTTLCRDPENVGPNWKPCDCPAHDMVAEMLGIVSTTGRDFRPAAERAQAVLDREAAQAFLIPSHPPRPRKPKPDPTKREVDEALAVMKQERSDYYKYMTDLKLRLDEFGVLSANEQREASQMLSAPVCRVCDQQGYISRHYEYPGPVEVSCDACNARWYADDPL